MISEAQFEVKRGSLYTAPGSQNVSLPQSGRVNFAPKMTSNLYSYRSAGIEQHYFPDEKFNKPGSNHSPKTAPVSLLYPYAVKYDDLFLPRPELSKFSGALRSLSYSSVTLKHMLSPDCKTRKHFFVYLFSIAWIDQRKNTTVF